LALRKKICLLIFLGYVFSGCATVHENITSDPGGAIIYWGKTEKDIKLTIYKTPFRSTISSSDIESWCYQTKLDSYHDSEIICKPSHSDDRNIHFVLNPVAVDQAVLFYLRRGDLKTSWKYLKTLSLSSLSDNDFDRRIELYEKYLSQNNFYAHIAAGYTCYEASKYQKAINYFETALRINKNEFDQYFRLGMSYKNIENHKEAIVYLENALRADPNHYGANYELGVIYGYPMLKASIYKVKTDYVRSIELLEIAKKIKPAEADVFYQLGGVYSQKEQYFSALKETQSAIKLREESKYFRQNGEIYEKLNGFDMALANYRKALATEESFKARYSIIDNLIRLKRYDETIAFINTTLAIYPSVSWLYNKIGDAYSEKGDHWTAIEYYKKFLQKEPTNYEAHFAIALSFLRLKKWNNSEYWWKKAIEVSPNESASFFNLGLVYYSKSQFEDAKNSFEKYLVANPDDEDGKLWLEKCRHQIDKTLRKMR